MRLAQRIEEMSKTEMALRSEAAELKRQLENSSSSFQQQARSDKESYKQKLIDAEKKNKEADAKRS